MSQPLKLEINSVSKTHVNAGRSVLALENITFSVGDGEFLVLAGPSGCGKSTLLNLIAGFETPTTGTILLDGKPVGAPGPDRLVMFQDHGLFPWLNVIDNIAFGLDMKPGVNRKQARELARSFLNLVNLKDFEHALVHELSGGMKHRVALARALAPDPEVLMIDEPFPSLDPLTRFQLYLELQTIFVETRKTIVAVTHDTLEAATLADRILVMSERPGHIVGEINVPLPRPRDVESPEVTKIAEKITPLMRRK